MDELETTNPVEGADVPETEVEAEVQTEPQFDDDGNPIEDQAEPEEEEEIDLDDLKLKLPKSEAEKVKAALLRQADYTRKTQELAEHRKAFEAEQASYQQASQQEQSARANLTLIDNQIAQYSKVNWNAFHDSDPFEAQKQFAQFQLLKDARTQTVTYLGHLDQERQSKQKSAEAETLRALTKLLDEGTPELKKEIPDWSRDKAAKLTDATMRNYGFTRDDLGLIDDPRLYRVMNDAAAWRDHQAKTKKAQTIQKQQEVQPAAKASRSSAPPQGLDDRLSADEWLRRRNAQLARRG
jgi:hypothetical protein